MYMYMYIYNGRPFFPSFSPFRCWILGREDPCSFRRRLLAILSCARFSDSAFTASLDTLTEEEEEVEEAL